MKVKENSVFCKEKEEANQVEREIIFKLYC